MGDTGGKYIINGENAPPDPPYEFDSIAQDSSILQLLPEAKHLGVNGYRTYFTGYTEYCYGLKTFSEEDELYLRFYIFIPTIGGGWATNSYQKYWFITGYDGDGIQKLFDFGVQTDVNKQPARFELQLFGGSFWYWTMNENMRDRWVCVEIRWKAGSGSDGGAGFYIDGVYRNGQFNLNHSSYRIDAIRHGYTGRTAGWPANNSYLYYDDIKADVQYVGEYVYPTKEINRVSNIYTIVNRESKL